MVSVAEPESKQKQHSKTRRIDMLVFRTSPITCSMLLACVILWGYGYPNHLFKPLQTANRPWQVGGPLIGPNEKGHAKDFAPRDNKAEQTNGLPNCFFSPVPTYIIQRFWFVRITILKARSSYCFIFPSSHLYYTFL